MGIMAALILAVASWSGAIDPNCTQTTNLSIYRCPQNSTDWFDSYTGIVDNLDSLSRTARSSFTVLGGGGLLVTYGVNSASFTGTSFSSAPIMYASDGDATNPPYARAADVNTGIYFSGNDIGFTSNGTVRATVGLSAGIAGGSGATTGQPLMRSAVVANCTDPQFQFVSDGDTGVGRSGSNRAHLCAGGVAVATFSALGMVIMPDTQQASTFGAAGFSVQFSSGVGIVAGALTNASIIDADIAASTISLSRLNQSGCATNDLASWNGTTWACSAAAASGEVTVSSFTNVPTVAPTFQSACNVCHASTTIVAAGSRDMFVSFSGGVEEGSTQDVFISFLEDGAPVTPYTVANRWAASDSISGTDRDANLSFTTAIRAPSAASHTYCVCIMSNVNQIDSFGVTAPRFGVWQSQ